MAIKIALLISIALSFYSLYVILDLQSKNDYLSNEQQHLKKQLQEQILRIKNLTSIVKKTNSDISSFKYSQNTKNTTFHDKIETLFSRWIIVADPRITSIPTDNKSWNDAMEIIKQAPQKVWRPNKTTQSKDSMVNGGSGGHMVIEEPNQDFSSMTDVDFEKILEESDDTDTSTGASQEQLTKPKPKKNKNLLPY